MNKKKLVRITTVPLSLDKLLSGQLRFMSDYYDVTAIASGKEYLEKVGKRENVAVYDLEMTRRITPLKDISAVLDLYRFLKKNKPFIVHSHTPKAGIVGMMAAKMAGVPNRLHTVAGLPLLESSGLKRKLLDFVEKLTYSCATKVYPNSFGLYDIIRQNKYCDPKKLKVLGNGSSNGIGTDHFSTSHFSQENNDRLKKSLGLTQSDFVFIFVGRIVADKGINELVAAFKRLNNEKNGVKLLLVGDFEYDLSPLDQATLTEIQTNSSIISAGFQNDVRPYFAVSDALAFPSYREGFPNVVMQAGAMGLPAIATDINGCNEIIENEVNGIIIPVKDSKALYDAMKKMLDDNELDARMKNTARKIITDRYEQRTVWQAILNEYRQLEPGAERNV